MLSAIRKSISRKLMAVVLISTFAALLVSAIALLGYELRTYQSRWVNDLSTQAEILARVSAPALTFDDAKAASENLASLRYRRRLTAAAIYDERGNVFGSWRADGADPVPQSAPEVTGYQIDGSQIIVVRPVVENGETVGTVYVRAHYELMQRLQDYLLILAAVMLAALAVAGVLALWMRAAFTRPILQVTQVARDVMQRRDFSRRARKASEDEIGVLVDAFNDMLDEVGRRTAALEEANRVLKHEMDERHGAEKALLEADRRKDEFLATLAHELRNPLAPLTSGLEILRISEGDSEATRKTRAIMDRQLRHMVRLIDDLLDVSRITTGKLAIRKSHVALQTLLNSAVEAIAGTMEKQRHQLQVSLPTEPVMLDADATRLVQVFFNLLSNAAKYTPPGGRIRLQATVEGKNARVDVIDNGQGLSPEVAASVFDMFVQADQSLERRNSGLGVGLTLARRLTELHGGTLAANSEGKGRGSTFTVILPLSERQVGTEPSPQAAEQQDSRPCRVLLVDDNVDFAESLASMLRGFGHTVMTVHDGADALRKAPEFDPDIAFIDIGLPGLNGYELARRLRDLNEFADTVLVAVTGWGQQKDKDLARDAGFDDHFVKPVQLDTILALIRRMQRGRGGVVAG